MYGNPISPDEKNSLSYRQQLFHQFPPRQYPWFYAIVIVVILILFWFLFFGKKYKTSTPKPIPVIAETARSADVPIYLSAIGNVIPTYSVRVKTQINGQMQQVYFKEGQEVKKGEVLAQIDPRPYEALLKQYEGNLKRDEALLANALIDLKRYQMLWKQNSISQQTLATQQSLVEQYQGAIRTDEGLIEGTKINLAYCKISSPIDGRIGLRLVDPGNLVQITDPNGIAVINTVQPITVIFSLPEDNIPQLMPLFYENKKLPVQVFDRQLNQLLGEGLLQSVDNQIDLSTGTFKLRGLFENKENKLFPNQFVNTKILIKTLYQATLIPTAAIQHSTLKNFVFVINEENKAIETQITTGPVSGEDTVIESGIKPGQKVVTAGSDKLKNGMQVVLNKPKTKANGTS